jgi:hypothetical protein
MGRNPVLYIQWPDFNLGLQFTNYYGVGDHIIFKSGYIIGRTFAIMKYKEP